MKNNVIQLPTRATIALPRRTTRPKTAVQKIKEAHDPLLMARIAKVAVEADQKRGR